MKNPYADESASGLSRRLFLQRLGAAAGAGALLAACAPEAGEPEVAEEALTCTDTTGLTEMEIQMRQTLQYVDDSPYEDRLCDNCQFWQPPAAEGTCGGCQLIKGPIHPDGYCASWAARQEATG